MSGVSGLGTTHRGRPGSATGDFAASLKDLQKLRDALIVLAGHLPLFSRNPEKRARALRHDRLRDEALDALDRVADELGVPRLRRVVAAENQR